MSGGLGLRGQRRRWVEGNAWLIAARMLSAIANAPSRLVISHWSRSFLGGAAQKDPYFVITSAIYVRGMAAVMCVTVSDLMRARSPVASSKID